MQYIISSLLFAGLVLAAPEAPLGGSNGAAPYPAAGSNSGPYPPSGWKPSGRLLVLPAKQVAQTYGVPSSTEAEPVTTEFPSVTPLEDESTSPAGYTNGFQFEQLQQQPGAEHGIYHVLLPEGRLQRVEYVTAPLKSEQSSNAAAQQNQQEQGKYQNQYAQQYQYQQNQNGKFQQGQYEQAQYTQFQQYPQGQYQQYPYQPAQSGKFQQGQFEQTSYPQPAAQAYFPSSFQQPQYQPQSSNYQQAQFSNQNNYQSSQYQQAKNGNYQPTQNGNYQQAQNGNYQQGQAEPNTYFVGYQQPQSNKYTQNKNQQPEYESNASQNQFNQKKFNKQQGSNANNQNKQVSTNVVSSESSRFTNANAASQQQQPTQEYTPFYYAQQQNGQETPAFAGFVANVQYKDVEPIPSPVYTYNPAPLVRILRKTEE